MAIGRAEFERIIRENMDLTPKEFQLIMLAYRLAKYGVRGKFRKDGTTRSFEHPKTVALIAIFEDALRGCTPRKVIKCLLHDTPEDSYILTFEDFELIFGKEIRDSLKIFTKDETLPKAIKDEKYFKQILGASSEDKDVKLCDRLHNMRTLSDCAPEKQKEYLEETISFYLPLAKKNNGHLYALLKEECQKYTKEELP